MLWRQNISSWENRRVYSAPMSVPGGSFSDAVKLTQSDCTVIYDIYDDLLARFPQYVSKSKMGEISGYDFNRYTFRYLPLENPEDPILGFLRRNVQFEVILVANPWGFSRNERKNEAGVDLNRNFEAYFIPGTDPSGDCYGGEAPGSEEETRLVLQFIEENMDAEVVLVNTIVAIVNSYC